MKKNHRPARATIDLSALQHNLSLALAHAGDATVLAVIKANGYGHGMSEVAKVLSAQADELDIELAVASVDDAICLRDAGETCSITCLSGFYTQQEIVWLVENNVVVVVYDVAQLTLLRDYAEQCVVSTSASFALAEHNESAQEGLQEVEQAPVKALRVWLKVDTGMGRLGFSPPQVLSVLSDIEHWQNVDCLGLLSHFANSDEPDNPSNVEQLTIFEQAYADAQLIHPGLQRSMANSAALLTQADSLYDMVRPGIMLFGASPLSNVSAAELGLRPVMTFASQLISVKDIKQGQPVGYGGTWTAPSDMQLGVVACGYGDGYPRHAPSGTPVLVNGRRCVLVGRVSMDLITVDLRGVRAQVGDEVILWGQGLPIEEVARHAETISYELTCGVTARVQRYYLPA